MSANLGRANLSNCGVVIGWQTAVEGPQAETEGAWWRSAVSAGGPARGNGTFRVCTTCNFQPSPTCTKPDAIRMGRALPVPRAFLDERHGPILLQGVPRDLDQYDYLLVTDPRHSGLAALAGVMPVEGFQIRAPSPPLPRCRCCIDGQIKVPVTI